MSIRINIFLLLTLSLMGIAATPAFGQCVRVDSFKVNSVAGHVVYVSKDRKQIEDLAGVSIRLLKTTSQEPKVIAEQITDASGSFSFVNVKPGKYTLEASMKMMDTVVAGIKVVKDLPKGKHSFFTVELGLTEYSHTDSCEGTVKIEWR